MDLQIKYLKKKRVNESVNTAWKQKNNNNKKKKDSKIYESNLRGIM